MTRDKASKPGCLDALRGRQYFARAGGSRTRLRSLFIQTWMNYSSRTSCVPTESNPFEGTVWFRFRPCVGPSVENTAVSAYERKIGTARQMKSQKAKSALSQGHHGGWLRDPGPQKDFFSSERPCDGGDLWRWNGNSQRSRSTSFPWSRPQPLRKSSSPNYRLFGRWGRGGRLLPLRRDLGGSFIDPVTCVRSGGEADNS